MGESPRLIETVDECQAKLSTTAWSSTSGHSPSTEETAAANHATTESAEADSSSDWLTAVKNKLPILYELQSGILRLMSDDSLWVYGNDTTTTDSKNNNDAAAAADDDDDNNDNDNDGGDCGGRGNKDDLQVLKANIDFQSAVEDLKETAVARLRLIMEYVQLFSKDMEDVTQSTYQRMEVSKRKICIYCCPVH